MKFIKKAKQTTYVLVNVNTGLVMHYSEKGRTKLHWTSDLNDAQTFTDRRQVVNFLNIHPKKPYGIGEVEITRNLLQ